MKLRQHLTSQGRSSAQVKGCAHSQVFLAITRLFLTILVVFDVQFQKDGLISAIANYGSVVPRTDSRTKQEKSHGDIFPSLLPKFVDPVPSHCHPFEYSSVRVRTVDSSGRVVECNPSLIRATATVPERSNEFIKSPFIAPNRFDVSADSDGSALIRFSLRSVSNAHVHVTYDGKPVPTSPLAISVRASALFEHSVKDCNRRVKIECLGGEGKELGRFRSPAGLCVDGRRLFVCDRRNRRVQILDLETGGVDAVLSTSILEAPTCVCVWSAMRLVVVTDKATNAIVAFPTDGSGQPRALGIDFEGKKIRAPTGIAVHGSDLVVVDRGLDLGAGGG
jgi:hypothetical protein